MRAVNEASVGLVRGRVVWRRCLFRLGLPLDRDGHAEGDCFLPFVDVTAKFEPAEIRVDRAWLQVPELALDQRQELIADGVGPEPAISLVNGSRLVYGVY